MAESGLSDYRFWESKNPQIQAVAEQIRGRMRGLLISTLTEIAAVRAKREARRERRRAKKPHFQPPRYRKAKPTTAS